MENFSQTEENYLKAIFKLSEREDKPASTNAIAGEMNTSAASVTDMLRRLAEKGLIHYEKYRGVALTEKGNKLATGLIRKHRLWEVFLLEKLRFSWDEVHDMAEQLEHIQSPELVERLDEYLGRPKFDPHGDPIPDAAGNFTFRKQVFLSALNAGEAGAVVGVNDHSPAFLQYLDRIGIKLGAHLRIAERFDYDESVRVVLGDTNEQVLSKKVSQNLFIQKF